ncbi:transglycosylase [Leptospira ryugenii]|uniref:peptidoglycan glycosyltransferase n=1 Tax=Leptospira ryugenii TaxID=1917863 RepID=A0A2P2E1Z6_9LEPT|nr:transglycosylase domain-containing protein [Leptospira ryugenii]GBF50874.1 transglycosylase [Leptospira ryugenii]
MPFVYLLFVLALTLVVFPVRRADIKNIHSTIVTSEERSLIGRMPTNSDQVAIWIDIKEFPDPLPRLIIEAEDRNFYYHIGFDPLAVYSSLVSHLFSDGRRGGASTITMQLSRILHPEWKKYPVLIRKGLEISNAIQIEFWLNKEEILESYINLVPIHSNAKGFPLASLRYFKKNIRFLSMEESVAFIILMRNPNPSYETFSKRYIKLYESFTKQTFYDHSLLREIYDAIFKAKGENIYALSEEEGHYLQWIKHQYPNQTETFESSLSKEMQSHLLSILNSELQTLKRWNVSNASLIVLSLSPEEKNIVQLKAMIGSKNFWDENEGMVNGSLSYRDAGSTIKPLLYASAIERNLVQIHTIVPDEKMTFSLGGGASYVPRNSDLKYWGELSLAESLSNSRNIPAVSVVNQYGMENFLNTLREFGFTHLRQSPDFYGPGIALGTGGASLFQLTRAYASFPMRGVLPKVFLGKADGQPIYFGETKRMFGEDTAEEIESVLSNAKLRTRAFGRRSYLDFPFPVALKTGTSKDYRNSWTIAWNESFVVGVWVGNFSGDKTMQVSGSFGAGRIVQNVFRYLVQIKPSQNIPSKFTDLINFCKESGALASEDCPKMSLLYSKRKKKPDICKLHRKENFKITHMNFIYPQDGQTFLYHPNDAMMTQMIPVKIRNWSKIPDTDVYWNEKVVKQIPSSGEFRIPIERGDHQLSIRTGEKILDRVVITVK